ncbi:hypothetical protein F4778DRAFT_787068 [Xylariomycetidae sp. FL2044]|nr:hypothetical protein F4778DRAFT_787068 [Xylariomycetidae sp. FL2044]
MSATINKGPRKPKLQTPQEAIDEFWSKFNTKTPGKAFTIIPHNEYADRAARQSKKVVGTTTTQASYRDAAALCQAKVEKISKECRRVNQRYRDPHFDLELDLKWGSRDTLQTLHNTTEKPESGFHPKSVKRVVDIFDSPKFFIDGPTANDVRQGRDGDCWFMAALCTLSNKPSLIERVCVARDEQEDRERINSEEQYRKAYQSGSGALYFAQCEHVDETWLPLLEKAYAKAHGDYAAIEGGYTGEGIEDLTGGVTTELYTTDILDKEHFWNEELMKVNDEFLFGCATGLIGWGERKGIVELHAYSVMRAVEIDNLRLVLLKNPWGKHEWNGPWSDGSKEWTAEWLTKLDHRFGNDGSFWISYDDLLRKYSEFERTRIFTPEWKVTSIWTTLSVPWTLDYHDTHFVFSLAKSGPVVIVLSQLDDRYYRGLEGQYRFELNFRVHKSGQENYVVRSISPYCQSRSINVELELEAGEYNVLLKINATRDMKKLPVEEVIRNNARNRRDKLVAVGMSYDLAHSKGRVVETAEEKEARNDAEKRKKDKERAELKKKIMDNRQARFYISTKDRERKLKKRARAKAVARAREAAKTEKTGQKKSIAVRDEPAPQPGETKEGRYVRFLSLSQTPLPENSSMAARLGSKTTSAGTKTPAEDTGISTTAEPPSRRMSGLLIDVPDDIEENTNPALPSLEIETMQNTSLATPAADAANSQQDEPEPLVSSDEQDESSDSDESDITSVSSVSDISDTLVDIELERRQADAAAVAAAQQSSQQQQKATNAAEEADEVDEFERNPWNAVATVGLRVYYKSGEEESEGENIVKLKVVRPNVYAEKYRDESEGEQGRGNDDDDDDDEKKDDGEGGKRKDSEGKGLDVDDSSKDATLVGDQDQRRKSILSLVPHHLDV